MLDPICPCIFIFVTTCVTNQCTLLVTITNCRWIKLPIIPKRETSTACITHESKLKLLFIHALQKKQIKPQLHYFTQHLLFPTRLPC